MALSAGAGSALSASSPAMATTAVAVVATPPNSRATTWPLGKVAFSLLPLAGTSTRRATVMEAPIENIMWTLDQVQGVVNVNVPVRMVVVRVSACRHYF